MRWKPWHEQHAPTGSEGSAQLLAIARARHGQAAAPLPPHLSRAT